MLRQKKIVSRKNSGSSIAEFALIAALVAGVGLTGSSLLGSEVNTLYARLGNVMTTGQESTADDLGDHTATQSLNMSGFSIIGLAAPVNDTDAATKGYVDTAVSGSSGSDNLGNHTATQILNMGTFRISSVGTPTDAADAATKGYVDSAIAGIPGGDNLGNHVATTNLALGANWLSGDGQSEGVFVTSDGLVGVGTNVPETRLDVSGVIRSRILNGGVELTGDSTRSILVLDPDASDGIGIGGDYLFLQQDSTAALISSGVGTSLGLGSSQRADITISSSGNVGIGILNPGTPLDVSGMIRGNQAWVVDPPGGQIAVYGKTPHSSGHAALFHNTSSNYYCYIGYYNQYSIVCAGQGSIPSDQRLKKDITNLDYASIADRVLALEPVTYRWKDERKGSEIEYGFIAQQVETLFPELVNEIDPTTDEEKAATNGAKMKAMNYEGLVSPLVATVKNQQARIEQLEAALAEQAALIESIRSDR